jgi:hypothetical protein
LLLAFYISLLCLSILYWTKSPLLCLYSVLLLF